MSLFSKKKKYKSISRIGLVNSKFPFAIREAYKTLHTNIVYSGIDASCKKQPPKSAASRRVPLFRIDSSNPKYISYHIFSFYYLIFLLCK